MKEELYMLEVLTHFDHCNRGVYENACKYGEIDCPALHLQGVIDAFLESESKGKVDKNMITIHLDGGLVTRVDGLVDGVGPGYQVLDWDKEHTFLPEEAFPYIQWVLDTDTLNPTAKIVHIKDICQRIAFA